jgi:hypothetical protein
MKEIILQTGATALVDDEDYDYLSEFKWYPRNTSRPKIDVIRNNNGSTRAMQRDVLGLDVNDKSRVRHINGNGMDNRKENLLLFPPGYRKKNMRESKPRISKSAYPIGSSDYKLDCRMWSLYRIRLEDYRRILDNQNGVCKICHGPPAEGSRLYVDHCHNSEVVRGLLCRACNTGIGQFKDNTDLLMRAIEYLQQGQLSD